MQPNIPPNAPPSPAPQHQPVDDTHLPVTQAGEVTIFQVKRHPAGILLIYMGIAVALIALAGLVLALRPSGGGSAGDGVTQLGIVVFLILATLGALYGFFATKIYWGNSWVLTSDSITQIEQTSLFHQQSSQLSLEHIEDVGAVQNGILPQLLNFGILKVETAGEQGRFHFHYCPNPRYYAQQILAAREAFMLNEHYNSQQHAAAQAPAHAQPSYHPPQQSTH